MPGSVINQPERLKRLESPFSLFLCGVAAGRCSSYLDSLATDATHVPRSCCCEQRSSFFFFFFTHFFSSPLHFSQPSFLLLFLLLLFLCSTRERDSRKGSRSSRVAVVWNRRQKRPWENKGLSYAYVSRIRDWGRLWRFVSL